MYVEKDNAAMPAPDELKEAIMKLKQERGAVILAHYYVRGEIQDIADFIGDSLALAQIASRLTEDVVVMCGVNFMGETVKMLCPDKTVLVPDDAAGCSLADSCDAGAFQSFIEANPGHTVISYVNTSAEVKALSDILVTSSNARKIVESFPADTPIIFGPDRNLGGYINSVTGRQMKLWDGACHVHDRFPVDKIIELKQQHPEAQVLAHPECRKQVLIVADKVGSTAALLEHAMTSDCREFIVATESGILHEMQKRCRDKKFIAVPPADSTCGCNDCNYMKLNTLEKLYRCLRDNKPQVHVDASLAAKARKPIERMLERSK